MNAEPKSEEANYMFLWCICLSVLKVNDHAVEGLLGSPSFEAVTNGAAMKVSGFLCKCGFFSLREHTC